jgi:hypothetical protein
MVPCPQERFEPLEAALDPAQYLSQLCDRLWVASVAPHGHAHLARRAAIRNRASAMIA